MNKDCERDELFALPMLVGHLLRSGDVPTIGERREPKEFHRLFTGEPLNRTVGEQQWSAKHRWHPLRGYRRSRGEWPREVE